MAVKVESENFRLDWLKWLLVLALVAGGVIANSYYVDQPMLYRVLAMVAIGIFSFWISINTAKGNSLWVVIKEAQTD